MNNATEPADTGSAPRGIAPRGITPRSSSRRRTASRRPVLGMAAAIASVGLAAAGCSAAAHPAAASAIAGPTTGPVLATASPAPTTRPKPATTSSPSVTASTSPAAAVPPLGRPTGVFARGQGFGQVKPSKIFNGGDPTGLVTHVVWKSWGGAQAVATGISEYVGPSQSNASGAEEAATVVAFDLGTCGGKLMYRAVEWYFPQHGQAFDPSHYEDICTGIYVPG